MLGQEHTIITKYPYTYNVVNLKGTCIPDFIVGNQFPVKKLFELHSDEKCVVIGTLFKNMEMKPNILKEISEEVISLSTERET